jgi:hypothetical protein
MLASTRARGSGVAVAVIVGGVLSGAAVLGDDGRAGAAPQVPCYAAIPYPGDTAPRLQLARWLGAAARAAGLPAELPVMAALADSGLRNRPARSGADSVGFFQMRVGTWNKGEYKGYPTNPQLQVKWFLDSAIAVKMQRYARGEADFGADPSSWGEWVADVERPAAQFRGRYAVQLAAARDLLK